MPVPDQAQPVVPAAKTQTLRDLLDQAESPEKGGQQASEPSAGGAHRGWQKQRD